VECFSFFLKCLQVDILIKIISFTKMLGKIDFGEKVFMEIAISVELKMTMLRKTVHITENTGNRESFN